MSVTDREAIDRAHFEQEAGQAVGDMPKPPPPDAPPPEELRVDGTAQLTAFDAGGKRPGSASIRLSGGKVDLRDDGLVTLRGRERHVGRVLVQVLRSQGAVGETLAEVVAGRFKHDALNLSWLRHSLATLEADVAEALRVVGLAHLQAEADRERERGERLALTRVPFEEADDFDPVAA